MMSSILALSKKRKSTWTFKIKCKKILTIKKPNLNKFKSRSIFSQILVKQPNSKKKIFGFRIKSSLSK